MYDDSDNRKMVIQTNNTSKTTERSDEFAVNLPCDKPIETKKVTDLDEFEKVLSEYREQRRNSDNNTEPSLLNTTNRSVTETIIEMGLNMTESTNNANNGETRQVGVNSNDVCKSEKPELIENLPIHDTQHNIKEEISQLMNAELDKVSLISNGGINIGEIEQNLHATNIFMANNENKSIEIEIDIKNEMTNESTLNNPFFDEFAEPGPSGFNYINFDIDDIELCDDSSINDMSNMIDLTDSTNDTKDITNTIDLTDSPDNYLLELETSLINVETSHTNDISKTDVSIANETKDEHISDNESNCSFHSSDFEIITEDEAKMDGLIINFRQQNETNDENAYNNEHVIDMCLPGPSDDYAYRENHRIPEGDEFLNMFHGIYAPAYVPDLIFLENKSVVPSQCMNVENDQFGFDVAALNKEVVNEECQAEAKETAKKILNSYHNDNERKLRRRPL